MPAVVFVLSAVVTCSSLAAATVELADWRPDGVVVVRVDDVPMGVRLAHLAPPTDDQAFAAARQRLLELTSGKRARLMYKTDFGTADDGLGRVHLRLGSQDLNEALVIEGLVPAVVEEAPGVYGKLIASAESRAKKAGKGIWSPAALAAGAAQETAAEQVVVATTTEVDKQQAQAAFCAELRGRYFYPVGHPAVTDVPAARLISYANAAEARRAGKRRAPEPIAAANDGAASVAVADAAFERGRTVYTKAVNLPPTDERNELYDRAFRELSRAVDLYNRLMQDGADGVEQRLRQAARMRYGAMKQRTI